MVPGIGNYCSQIFEKEEEKNGGYAGLGRECQAYRLNWFRNAAKVGGSVYAPNQTHAADFHNAIEEMKARYERGEWSLDWQIRKCKWD